MSLASQHWLYSIRYFAPKHDEYLNHGTITRLRPPCQQITSLLRPCEGSSLIWVL